MINGIIKSINRLIKPPKVIIKIAGGNAITTKGKVSRICLNEILDFFKDNEIKKGKIFVVEGEYGQKLEFSKNIPNHIHQRIRNLWNCRN